MAERGAIVLLSSAPWQPGWPGWMPLCGVELSNFLERSVLLESVLEREETTVSPGSRRSSPHSSSMLNCWPAQQMHLLEGYRNPCGKAEAQHFANLKGAVGRQPWQARDVVVCVGEREQQLLTSVTLWLGARGSLGLPGAILTPGTQGPRSILNHSLLLPHTISLFLLPLCCWVSPLQLYERASQLPTEPIPTARLAGSPHPHPPSLLPRSSRTPSPARSKLPHLWCAAGVVSGDALGMSWHGAGCRHPGSNMA